jgi:hypothetical protein
MAGYKVPQDVEAEDKFLGPLTFKQFLFAGAAAIIGYLILFVFVDKGIWLGVAILLPFFVLFGVLAYPWSRDQPTELWLASRIRFLLVPRKRIWDQSGMKDLVEITVPKRELRTYSDGLSKDQVYSRVNALASVVDTRGWAIKNYTYTRDVDEDTDRLVAPNLPEPDEDDQILATTQDIMDENNPLLGQFSNLMQQSELKHKQETMAKVDEARHPDRQQQIDDIPLPNVAEQLEPNHSPKKKANTQDLWFLNQPEEPIDPNFAKFQTNTIVAPGAKNTNSIGMGVPQSKIKEEDEQKLLKRVHTKKAQEEALKQNSHLKTIQPISAQDPFSNPNPTADDPSAQMSLTTSVTPVDPAILALSANDDLSVETLARQAKKDMPDEGEVIIPLR